MIYSKLIQKITSVFQH